MRVHHQTYQVFEMHHEHLPVQADIIACPEAEPYTFADMCVIYGLSFESRKHVTLPP